MGSDGLILIEPSGKGDAFMHMFNSDGSEGKMCGNGIRCVARYIYDHRIISEDRRHAVIDTATGLREVDIEVADGEVTSVTVDMGSVLSTGAGKADAGIPGGPVLFESIDIGNPHAVVFLDGNNGLGDSLEALPLKQIGMAVENCGLFPDGVNVEFIEVTGPGEIRMRVWERGSGETLACGTGAAASASAGCITGRLKSPVLVHLAGGDLTIDYDTENGKCLMTGPAEYVFTGEYDV